MSVYLHLFHGRDHPDQNLDDWGADGPVIGPLRYVHVTYMCDIKFAMSLEVAEKFFPTLVKGWDEGGLDFHRQDDAQIDANLNLVDDLVFHEGKYYGDWSVSDTGPRAADFNA